MAGAAALPRAPITDRAGWLAGFAAIQPFNAELSFMAGVDFTKLPAFHSTEEILAHPRFSFARDEFVKAILVLYEHKPSLNRVLQVPGSEFTSPSWIKSRKCLTDCPIVGKSSVLAGEQKLYFCNAVVGAVTKLSLATRRLPLHIFKKPTDNQNQIRFLSRAGSNHGGRAPRQDNVIAKTRKKQKSKADVVDICQQR